MKFTIIVPCFNLDKWIVACLDSIQAQTFEDWECIVVDDESTDESPQILDRYAEKDSRFKVIHQENRGEGGARNAGLKAARGEWIIFLDGDDVIHFDALNVLQNVIERRPNTKLVRFGYINFADGSVCNGLSSGAGKIIDRDIAQKIKIEDFFTYATQHTYRRDAIEGVEFKRYIRGCDRIFVDDVLLNRVDSFVETDAVLYGYRKREGSAMNKIPSTQVIIDEMEHRRDIVLMVEKSGKAVDYGKVDWFDEYFTRRVGEIIAEKPKEERRRLWATFLECVKEMSAARGHSGKTKQIYRICSLFPSTFTCWLMCRWWPWYVKNGTMPRCYFKLKKLFR